MNALEGKVAIITGAASGIGKATALLFSQNGARIVVADWNSKGGEAVVQAIQNTGQKATTVTTDVSSVESIKSMINHALDTFGHIDILMNNAGVSSSPAPIHATDDNDWNRVIDICLKGTFLGMKYVLPQMMEQDGGNIINVASIAGIIGAPGLTPYSAAKAGIIELTKTAALEYSRYNIRCNALAPGWTNTAMVDSYIGSEAETEQRMLRGIPMRR